MQTPDLSDKQFASVQDSDGRVNLWHGSIRSGKTIGSLLRWLLFVAATLTKSGDLVMFGRTRDSVWRNCIGPMQDPNLFGPIAAQVRGNYGAPTVTILGRRVYVIGAHDVQAELVLRGLTVLGAYGDEVTTIPEGFFLQMLGRMSTPWSRLFGTTNPDSPGHWLKKMIDRALPDWRVFHFVIDDNPSLLSSYVEAIKREYTGLWYRRFILGEWVVAEGAVYDSWDERLVVEPDQIPAMDRVLTVGVDYGTTNATAGLLLGLAEHRLWLLDEWAPKSDAGRSLTDAEQSASFRAWLPSRPVTGWQRPDWVHVDPAAASFRLQLFQDGVTNVAAAWNDVLPGIRMVSSLMATDRLRVSRTCQQFRAEVVGYSWDPKATERGEDAPIKTNDHFCLDGATLVATEAGQVPISSVHVGDRVWTRDGLREVTWSGMTRTAAPVLDLHLSDGSTLRATADHPVFVASRGWVRMDALRYGDTLVAWAARCGSAPAVVRLVPAGTTDVYNLTVEGTHEFFANGVLVHNCDAARYAIASSSPTWRPHLPILSADTMRGAAA